MQRFFRYSFAAASLVLFVTLADAQDAKPAPSTDQQTVPAPATPVAETPVVTPAVAPAPASVTDPAAPEDAKSAVETADAPQSAAIGKKNAKGKKKKEKAPKLVPVTVEHGVLTVDGWAGKADLNYQIADFHFFYIWSPGLGTVVISNQEFRGAKFQPNAFDGGTLTVQADGHTVQLASEHKLMIGKKPESAYVLVDPDSPAPGRYPQVGYGLTSKAPYSWPGALADTAPKTKAPPLPEALRPTLASSTKCDIDGAGKKTNCHEVTSSMYLGKNDKGELKQTDLTKDPSRPTATH